MKTANDCFRALVELGNTHEEVAESLKKLGIKGDPQEAKNCPIANYLTSKGYKLVSVGTMEVETANFEAELTSAVEDFITQFDHGEYPELEIEA